MRRAGTLIYDSAHVGARMGARALAGLTAEDRTLCYRSHGVAVDLLVSVSDALQLVHGQVLHERSGVPVSNARVRFGQEGEVVATDAFGQFALSALVGGAEQVIWIEAPGVDVRCSIPVMDRIV
jgi:hypothetical protein